MKALFKFLHILIMGYFVITGNTVYDQILTAIIAVIGFIYAFKFTGDYTRNRCKNSTWMSLVHWSVRTAVSIVMILITKVLYLIINFLFSLSNDSGSGFYAVGLCALVWIVIAEILKSKTGLKKKYFN
jgi:hypothetical protein